MNIIKRHKAVKEIKDSIIAAFPVSLQMDVDFVIHHIGINFLDDKICCNIKLSHHSFTLPNNERVYIPYRLQLTDYSEDAKLTPVQHKILHCIYSRSTDGLSREKHIKALLEDDMPFWVFPFVLKLSDEYVIEILETIYSKLKDKENTEIKAFCQTNLTYFVYSHARMVSYWNYFYRSRCHRYRNYIGKKLYHECFGYSKKYDRLFNKTALADFRQKVHK